jgi:hypothetical protein
LSFAGKARVLEDGTVLSVSAYPNTITRTLVIDPAILFSGYFGGSSEASITSVEIEPE